MALYLTYFDESGDDGFPKYSSILFVLTSLYLHYHRWKKTFLAIQDFRRTLKKKYGLPVKIEFHTKYFILNKKPYRELNIPKQKRKEILFLISKFISSLEIKVISVVINKQKIKTKTYNVFENATKYNIQRIENDLTKEKSDRFLIITDEGRVGKMRSTTRKIQRINIIPSKFTGKYRKEIELLIEDPLPKKSQESYFIQIADFIAYIVYLYSLKRFTKKEWGNRVKEILKFEDINKILENLKPILNLKASSNNKYGIVCYPK